jgi:hypothetical protein
MIVNYHQQWGNLRISTELIPYRISLQPYCNPSILGAFKYKDHQLLDVGHQLAWTRINHCVLFYDPCVLESNRATRDTYSDTESNNNVCRGSDPATGGARRGPCSWPSKREVFSFLILAYLYLCLLHWLNRHSDWVVERRLDQALVTMHGWEAPGLGPAMQPSSPACIPC